MPFCASVSSSSLSTEECVSTRALSMHVPALSSLCLSAYTCPLVDLDLTRVKALFDVNFFAALAMVQVFLPLLLATPGARILNVGSVAGVCPVPFGGAYNASKAALHAMGNTLRVELAPFKCVPSAVVLMCSRSFIAC